MFVRTRADLLFARPNLLFKYCTCLLFEMSHVPLLLKPNSKTGIKITVWGEYSCRCHGKRVISAPSKPLKLKLAGHIL